MQRKTITQGSAETITRTVELTHKYMTRANEIRTIVSAVTITIDLNALLTNAHGVGEKAATNKSRKAVEASGAIVAKSSRIEDYTAVPHVQ